MQSLLDFLKNVLAGLVSSVPTGSQGSNTKNSTKGTALYVSGIGLILYAPSLTTITYQEMSGAFSVFFATGIALVVLGMLTWFVELLITSRDRSKDG